MIDHTITVTHEVGLHARPAATFVKKAAEFDSAITIENVTRGSDPMNAKSVVSVFKAAVAQGHDVKIVADGTDEREAMGALIGLIESNFGE
jgi:phosphotransferase system HPr (HPr) family protein